MSTYVTWLRKGLREDLARRISVENLELIVENGRASSTMRQILVSSEVEFEGETEAWACTPINKDTFQLLPVQFKSVSFPVRYRVSSYPKCVAPQGLHCMVKLFMAHPYLNTREIPGYMRFMVFGQRPENTLIVAVHTESRTRVAGRTHKSYALGKQWIHYGLSIPEPTMGHKIPYSY